MLAGAVNLADRGSPQSVSPLVVVTTTVGGDLHRAWRRVIDCAELRSVPSNVGGIAPRTKRRHLTLCAADVPERVEQLGLFAHVDEHDVRAPGDVSGPSLVIASRQGRRVHELRGGHGGQG